jgi:DNA-binding transcriptional LysR family regulator
MVGLRSITIGNLRPMDFVVDGAALTVMLPVTISVTGAESYLATARLGLGLVQVPRFHAQTDLERGTLVQVLPDCPPSAIPVSLLYPRNRQLSPRVRVFVDWLVRAFGADRRDEAIGRNSSIAPSLAESTGARKGLSD